MPDPEDELSLAALLLRVLDASLGPGRGVVADYLLHRLREACEEAIRTACNDAVHERGTVFAESENETGYTHVYLN